jgi:hypothetical protein
MVTVIIIMLVIILILSRHVINMITKEQKKKNVELILNKIKELIDKSIDIDIDNDFRAYEIIFQAVNLYIPIALQVVAEHADTMDKETLLDMVENYLINIQVPDAKVNSDGSHELLVDKPKTNVVTFPGKPNKKYDC